MPRIEVSEGLKLPLLTGKPSEHTAFHVGVVGDDQLLPGRRDDFASEKVGKDDRWVVVEALERTVALLEHFGSEVDLSLRHRGTGQILQLHSAAGVPCHPDTTVATDHEETRLRLRAIHRALERLLAVRFGHNN